MSNLFNRVRALRASLRARRVEGRDAEIDPAYVTLDTLVRTGSTERLAGLAATLADQVRAIRPDRLESEGFPGAAYYVVPADVELFELFEPRVAVEILGIASLNPDGYVRQAALEALTRLSHPRATPFALIRLSDWVPQVRAAADVLLNRLLEIGIADELIRSHRLVDRLLRVNRVDLSEVHRRIVQELQLPRSEDALACGLADAEVNTRLFCLRILADSPLAASEFARIAMADPDPTVRRWFALRVVNGETAVTRDQRQALLSDAAASVAVVMLRSLDDEGIDENRQLIRDLVHSDSKRVRASARFVLGQDQRESFATAARALIAGAVTDGVRPGWISSLGETGQKSDGRILRRYLDHPAPRVRAAAVGAIVAIDPESSAPAVAARLADPSGRVRRAAVQALARIPMADWIEAARQTFANNSDSIRLSAFEALLLRSGWASIPAVLEALIVKDPALQDRAWHAVTRWWGTAGRFGWIVPDTETARTCVEWWPRVSAEIEPPSWAKASWLELGARLRELQLEQRGAGPNG